VEELLEEVLEDITPTSREKERENQIIQEILDQLGGYDVEPIVVGSTSKGTDLSGDKDLDIFLQFPAETTRQQLEEEGLSIGKETFHKLDVEYEIDYSEHPYTKGVYKGYEVELVPCYSEEGIKSSVDRTPLHTEYVKEKIRENTGLGQEIRLLKKFMKGVNIYGAEEKIRGFSGYLVEILTIHYGGFRKTLKASANWSIGEVIDPESQWDNIHSLKYYFPDAPLIVVDPVDKDRNVAAAVSMQKMSEYMVAAREFLEDPDKKYFYPPQKPVRDKQEIKEDMAGRETRYIAFKFTHPKLNENQLYSQLRKTEKSINREFKDKGFRVFKSSFYSNDEDLSVILFEFSVYRLPSIKHHPGPPIDAEPLHQERFHKKYADDGPYLLKDRWVVDTRRKYTQARQVADEVVGKRRGFGKQLREVDLELVEGLDVADIDGVDWLRHLDSLL